MKFFPLLLLLMPFLGGDEEKVVTYKVYKSKNRGGLCGSNIMLNSDSSFFTESGCEGSSDISFGSWKVLNDTIVLTTVSSYDYWPIITEVAQYDSANDGITIRFISLEGDTVRNDLKPAIHLRNEYDKRYRHTGNYKIKDLKGKRYIHITSLEKAYRTDVVVSTEYGNDITVYLNFPNMCLWGKSIYYENREYPMSLLIKGDSLISLPDHPLGPRYHLEKEGEWSSDLYLYGYDAIKKE